MQFENPKILYFLFAICIPIIIHLFQFQKFEKTPFSNVQFLQQIIVKNRKSSALKKWLILTVRILLFSSIIFAFSKPYLKNNNTRKTTHKIIYIDNSLSMQTKGNEGELLKTITRKVSENISKNNVYSLITNDHFIKKINGEDLKEELKKIEYSANSCDLKTIITHCNNLKHTQNKDLSEIFLITDFQLNKNSKTNEITNVKTTINTLKTTPNKTKNLYIDSLYIKDKGLQKSQVTCIIKSLNFESKNTPIALFNNKDLISKKTFSILKNETIEIDFEISKLKNFNGKIEIIDEYLSFDNTLFFNIKNDTKNNVFSVGKTDPNLPAIFPENEFNFTQKNVDFLDYNLLLKQDLIILNELHTIPQKMIDFLLRFHSESKSLVIIPAHKIDIESYQKLFNKLNLGKIISTEDTQFKITEINYSHPLFKNVFTHKVENFQYPYTIKNIQIKSPKKRVILSLENNSSFVFESRFKNNSIYIFETPISKEYSNFKNSPLIVPIFYNIGKLSNTFQATYYTLGTENKITINTKNKNNSLVSISDSKTEFTPKQQQFTDKTIITTNTLPNYAGNFNVNINNEHIERVAYNYNRNESVLNYAEPAELFKNNTNVNIFKSFDDFAQKLNTTKENNTLFKWFLASAILFLLLEIVIIKFL